jgi:3-oxoadipate enol-lactonase
MILNHVLDGADGAPPLLLGPSLGTAVAMWDPNIVAFAERFRVVRFDHRGEGASPSPAGPYEIADLGRDVLELLDSLGIERTSYAGVSIGGMVGMWLAVNAPERIDRLVLICTAAYLGPPSRWAERAAAVRAAGSTEAIADGVVDGWLTPEFAAARPEVRAWLRGMLVASPPDGYVECCGALERMDQRGDLPRISAPTLVIAGARDPATPPDIARVIAGGVPGARLEVVDDAAHLANVQHPDAVNALILEHLEEAH